MTRRQVVLHCVYDHPRDFPRHVVVRRFIIDADDSRPRPMVIGALYHSFDGVVLDYAHLEWIDRAADDDPVILGCWV